MRGRSWEDEKDILPTDAAAVGTLLQGCFLESTKVQDECICYPPLGFLKCFKSGRPRSDQENITECKKIKGVEISFQHLSQGDIWIKLLFVYEWKPVYFIEIQTCKLMNLFT